MLEQIKRKFAAHGYPFWLFLIEVGLVAVLCGMAFVVGRPAWVFRWTSTAYTFAIFISTILFQFTKPPPKWATIGPAVIRIAMLASAVGLIAVLAFRS